MLPFPPRRQRLRWLFQSVSVCWQGWSGNGRIRMSASAPSQSFLYWECCLPGLSEFRHCRTCRHLSADRRGQYPQHSTGPVPRDHYLRRPDGYLSAGSAGRSRAYLHAGGRRHHRNYAAGLEKRAHPLSTGDHRHVRPQSSTCRPLRPRIAAATLLPLLAMSIVAAIWISLDFRSKAILPYSRAFYRWTRRSRYPRSFVLACCSSPSRSAASC